jgi:hypothetical protein
MMGLLLNSLATLKTLSDRLTNAANLDNADAAITTMAPANTALSTGIWTGTKAGYLDESVTTVASQTSANTAASVLVTNMDNYLSTLLAGILGARNIQTGFVGSLPSVQVLSDIERRYYTQVSITPVADAAKCFVLVHGYVDSGNTTHTDAPHANFPLAYLVSTSVLEVSCYNYTGQDLIPAIQWKVIELM